MRTLPVLLLSLLVMAGSWFGFPNPVHHLPAASLLLPAGLFLLARNAPTPRRAFRIGYLVGGAALGVSLYWVALPVHDFGGVPWALAGLCPLLISLVLGLFTSFYTLVCRTGFRSLSPIWTAVMAGLAWAVSEYFRSILFTGFPWNLLPAAFVPWPVCIQSLSLVGVYGLSAILATSACLMVLVTGKGRQRVLGPVLGAGLMTLLLIHGQHVLDQELPHGDAIDVALVQGNIDQNQKWVPEFQLATIERYATLSRSVAEDGPLAFIVWPETAVPFFFQEKSMLSDAVRDLARELETPLLIGAPGYRAVPPPDDYVLFNRAYLLDEEGIEVGIYGKEHLVPFGEYIPLNSILFFLNKLVDGMGDFQPGLSTTPIVHDNLALGVLICYESIFTELANRRISSHANLLVNISNDAWFGRSSAPRQHLYLTALRAVEQGRYLVRGTNTGISAIIDPRGRIVEESDLFRPAAIRGSVRLLEEPSLYHRIYSGVIPVLAGLLAGFFIVAVIRPERNTA